MRCLCRMAYGPLYHETYCSGPVGEYSNRAVGTQALYELMVDMDVVDLDVSGRGGTLEAQQREAS